MMDCVLGCLLSRWFLINWFIGILLIEYAFKKTRSVRNVKEERDGKYPAFRRWDVKLW
jgi:hypothetical protein